ncbi:glycosyltransferase family 2 protein [Chloroflexota bacterium]|nr:glycosyltransferase family 2 protein [Chloroflexota bacterium]
MNIHTTSRISIVVPIFNEAEILEQFHHNLRSVLNELPNPANIYYIDDGSTDSTPEILYDLAQKDELIRVITLSRNFGHQAALSCGIESADGDAIITMDGDGQNPPELIPEMVKFFQAGYDIVICQRKQTQNQSLFKRLTSQRFYKLINTIGDQKTIPNAADFRLLSKRAAQALISMPEYHRFLRGMIGWIGFKSTILQFDPPPRIGGQSKYTVKKMLNLANDAIFSFSLFPLKLGLFTGGLFYFLALIEILYILFLWISGNTSQLEPGWSSLMFMILIVGGTLTTVISFIGIYIGYIFQEVKNRPVYIIKEKNIPPSDED